MAGRRTYDLMYRARLAWMFWSRFDRPHLRRLVEGGPCDPSRLAPPSGRPPRAIDLGCGEGRVSIYLAQRGFETTGVDFSAAAVSMARRAATRAGLEGNPRFIEADLTAGSIPDVEGPFDLLVDYGTLDDLTPDGRRQAAALVTAFARPGARLHLFAFYGRRSELPRFSLVGPSRVAPEIIEPEELDALFATDWDIEPLERRAYAATFLMTRKEVMARSVTPPT